MCNAFSRLWINTLRLRLITLMESNSIDFMFAKIVNALRTCLYNSSFEYKRALTLTKEYKKREKKKQNKTTLIIRLKC